MLSIVWGSVVSTCVRNELRRGPGSFVIAVLIATVAGGSALLAAAGARRSDSAFPRFLEWSHPIDFATGGAPDDATLAADIKTIEHAPFVDAFAHIPIVGAHVRTAKGRELAPFQVAVVGDVDGGVSRGNLALEKVLRGRRADPASPTDATVSFAAADRIGVDVGDPVTLVPDEGGKPITVTVVGVVARANEFPTLSGPATSAVVLARAFKQEHPTLFTPGNDGIGVRVKPGTPRADVERWLQSNVRGTDIEDQTKVTTSIERTIRIETVALWSVAAVLAFVFLIVLAQNLFRQAVGVAGEVSVLKTLGFTRRQVVSLGAARGVFVGVIGAAGAVVIAVVASPLTPVGLARLAEPSPGVRVDGFVMFFGAAAIVVTSALLGVLAAWRAGAPRRARRTPRKPVPLPAAPPPVAAGLQMIVRPRRQTEARLARVTLASLGLALAAATAVLVMLTSLSHLRSTARLAGATWDGVHQLENEKPTAQDLDGARARLAAMPEVAAVGNGGWTQVVVGDKQIPVQVFDDDGEIRPAIAAGRAPRAGELALGADEMRKLHVGIGDHLRVASQPDAPATDIKVVGRSVLISPVFRPSPPGEGGALTIATLNRLGVPRLEAASLLVVRLRPGTDVARAIEQERRALGDGFSFTSQDRTVVGGVERIQTVPVALVVVLFLLFAAGFVHVLLVSTRGHRRDIAVLRTVGFTRGQVMSMVAAEAASVALLTLAIGVPLGFLAGKFGWSRFADYLRAVAETSAPTALVAAIALAVCCVAAFTAIGAGLYAASRTVAPDLEADDIQE
jgi:putative ABC transport system permease protein